MIVSVTNGHGPKLRDIDPSESNWEKRAEAEAKTAEYGAQLTELNELMYASDSNGVLIVLQGMDTSGKDGTIRCLLNYANTQSTKVVPFKAPTPQELAHDFLWRIHAQAPMRGQITIFNRSHYEDVLIARVHHLADADTIEHRYKHIKSFENFLVDSGVIIMKFFLHISKDEQKERLLDREKEPGKGWKLNAADWEERKFWDDYQRAYEIAIDQCSSADAPWHIIPADRKWYRNYCIMKTIVETLQPHSHQWRKLLDERGKQALAELEAYRKQHSLENA